MTGETREKKLHAITNHKKYKVLKPEDGDFNL